MGLISWFPSLFCLSTIPIHPSINIHNRSTCIETLSWLGSCDFFWSKNFEHRWCLTFKPSMRDQLVSSFSSASYDGIIPYAPVPLFQVSVEGQLVWVPQLTHFSSWTIGNEKKKKPFSYYNSFTSQDIAT